MGPFPSKGACALGGKWARGAFGVIPKLFRMESNFEWKVDSRNPEFCPNWRNFGTSRGSIIQLKFKGGLSAESL